MLIDCPCLTRQEIGLPCARAAQLMLEGGLCDPSLPGGCVAEFLTFRLGDAVQRRHSGSSTARLVEEIQQDESICIVESCCI